MLRHPVREALLGRLALLLGQLPGRHGGVDARLRGALDGGVELVARDVQALGDVVEEGFLLGGAVGGLGRRGGLSGGSGIRSPGTRNDRKPDRTHRELALGGDGHAPKSTARPSENRKNAIYRCAAQRSGPNTS